MMTPSWLPQEIINIATGTMGRYSTNTYTPWQKNDTVSLPQGLMVAAAAKGQKQITVSEPRLQLLSSYSNTSIQGLPFEQSRGIKLPPLEEGSHLKHSFLHDKRETIGRHLAGAFMSRRDQNKSQGDSKCYQLIQESNQSIKINSRKKKQCITIFCHAWLTINLCKIFPLWETWPSPWFP